MKEEGRGKKDMKVEGRGKKEEVFAAALVILRILSYFQIFTII